MAIGIYGPEQFQFESGAPARNISVAVFLTGTTVEATLFFDKNGLITAPNPMITDQYGSLMFFTEVGTYDLVAAGVVTTVVVDQAVTPEGSDFAFAYTQVNASARWPESGYINHQLGFNPAGIQIIDSQGDHIGYQTLTYVDDNNLFFTFSAAISGTADLS